MHCPACGSKNVTNTYENFGEAKQMMRAFQVHVPLAEIWVCSDCDTGWGLADGVLHMAGTSHSEIPSVRIPAGALAVFGEKP